MVVLDHHLVAEIQPMACASAGQDGGDVERSESGGGLSGVEDPAARAGDGLNVGPGGGGDAAGALEQVQHRPLRPQDAGQGAVDQADRRSRRCHAAVGSPPFDPAVAGPRHCVGVWPPRHHSTGPILDPALGIHTGGDGEPGRDIAVPVLREGRGRDALRVGRHRPSATIRSMAPRARAAISGGTVTWNWSSRSESRTPVMVIAFM